VPQAMRIVSDRYGTLIFESENVSLILSSVHRSHLEINCRSRKAEFDVAGSTLHRNRCYERLDARSEKRFKSILVGYSTACAMRAHTPKGNNHSSRITMIRSVRHRDTSAVLEGISMECDRQISSS
jgi:hypothetical protein